jgi:hypothetical protein
MEVNLIESNFSPAISNLKVPSKLVQEPILLRSSVILVYGTGSLSSFTILPVTICDKTAIGKNSKKNNRNLIIHYLNNTHNKGPLQRF